MTNTYIIARKIQLIPVGKKEEVNRVYTYIKDGIKSQYGNEPVYECFIYFNYYGNDKR